MIIKRYITLITVLLLAPILFTYHARAAEQTIKEKYALMGSVQGGKYHMPSCKLAKNIKAENMVGFKDAVEAESKGYNPCKKCIPKGIRSTKTRK